MRILAIVALVALAACAAREEPDEPETSVFDADLERWQGTLRPQSGSNIRGSVDARTAWVAGGPGRTIASISIAGARSDAHHPWHIHQGTCESGGPIIGNTAAYSALHVGADGTATARATLSVGLNPNQNYHVNVHRSPENLGTIVACGNIDD